jgi:uncharacterized RDD family membrane protein YckC
MEWIQEIPVAEVLAVEPCEPAEVAVPKPPTASPWQRILGYAIDALLLSSLDTLHRLGAVGWGVIVGVGAVYEIVLTATFGRTLGKLVAKSRVVTDKDGRSKPGWGASALRWFVPGVVSLLAAVGGLLADTLWVWTVAVYLPIAWDPWRQGLHDRFAHTLVLDTRQL